MPDRKQIAETAAKGLRAFASKLKASPVVVGFDGFVDSIIEVVDKRHDADRYDGVPTIEHFGRKILAAAGKSSNYELMVKLEKLGGNGPIMANALASIGFPVTYVGAIGKPAVHSAFAPLAEHATCHTICEPGTTDALEFDDGKLMISKYSHLSQVNAETMRRELGDEKAKEVFGPAVLIGMVNWTMLTGMNGIWKYLAEDILRGAPKPAGGHRWVFIDLADPEKRTRADLKAGLEAGAKFQSIADVIFGFNLKEAVQVAEVLGFEIGPDPEAEIELMSHEICRKLGVHTVVIHPRGGAAATSTTAGGGSESASFAGPLVQKPKLSTGAGDNFNAGFCLGRLAGLPIDQSLCVGTATSGFYVRNARSGTLAELADFCDHLPEPE